MHRIVLTLAAKPVLIAVSAAAIAGCDLALPVLPAVEQQDEGVAANQPPTADAGDDQTVESGATVTLQGSGTDPEGAALAFFWFQVSGGTFVELADERAATTTFTAPQGPDVLVFRLTVRDDANQTAQDTVTITVNPPPDADADRPAVTAATATAVPGASNDTITVTFDDDMNQTDVTTLDNYTFSSPVGQTLDLTGASIAYDPVSRTATITLDQQPPADVNLKRGASFAIIVNPGVRNAAGFSFSGSNTFFGIVDGDDDPPAITSAVQNLDADPLGRTIDITWDEPMEDTVDTTLAPDAYRASGGQTATTVSAVSATLTRVTFDSVVIPGIHTLTVSSTGPEDLAGNAFPGAAGIAVAGSDTTPPGVSEAAFVAVSGPDNDFVTVTFSEPVVPADAETLDNYDLESPDDTDLDATGATIFYDPDTRTTTIVFTDALPAPINLQSGDTFEVTVTNVRDVAGNTIDPAQASATGSISGDITVGPTVVSVTQNTAADPTGATLDVLFDEALTQATAEDPANYVSSGGQNVSGNPQLLDDLLTVRVTFDALVAPGSDTLAVSNVTDLAGNAMQPAADIPIASDDTDPPAIASCSASIGPRIADDTITITFDDHLDPATATPPANWVIESPIGTGLTHTGSAFAWDSDTRTLTITLDDPAGPNEDNLAFDGSFRIAPVDATTITDVAGNFLPASACTGTVRGDGVPPALVGLMRVDSVSDATVRLIFDRAIDTTSAESDVTYDDGGAAAIGATRQATGDTIQVTFPATVDTGVPDISFQDLFSAAGIRMPPVDNATVDPEDTTAPTASLVAEAVSGAGRDTLVITWSETMHPLDIINPDNFTAVIDPGGTNTTIDLANASFRAETGDTVTRIILPEGIDLPLGQTVRLTPSANIRDAHGVAYGGASIDDVVGGDSAPPAIMQAVLNTPADPAGTTVDVVFDEVVDPTTATDPANYASADGTINADSVTLPHPRVARVVFDASMAGQTVRVTGIADLAGNTLGADTMATDAAPALTAPTVVSGSSGTVSVRDEADRIYLRFDKPLDPGTITAAGIRIRHPSTNTDFTPLPEDAVVTYDAQNDWVIITLPECPFDDASCTDDLDSDSDTDIHLIGFTDLYGNPVASSETIPAATISPANLDGFTNDTTAPVLLGGPVAGPAQADIDPDDPTVVYLTFDERLKTSVAENPATWSHSTQGIPTSATLIHAGRTVRLRFPSNVSPADTIGYTDLEDAAGNADTQAGIPLHD